MTAGVERGGAARLSDLPDIAVGLGRMAASADRGQVLSALGLGSCIGLVMIDPRMGVAGLAHVMLPASRGEVPLPGKYADTAAPALLAAVVALGARRRHVVVKMAGGAEMFAAGSGGRTLAVGERNAEAVHAAVAALRLSVAAADTGGSTGRTLRVDVASGLVTVRSIGAREREL
jgi:chemotaxis protein CheD